MHKENYKEIYLPYLKRNNSFEKFELLKIHFSIKLSFELIDKYKIFEGETTNKAIEKHLKLKCPSLLLNKIVVYTEENEEENFVGIDINNLLNDKDVVSLEEFSEYDLENKYKLIILNKYGYHSDSLLMLNNKHPVLPLDRKPALIINYINLMLSGIINHHYKIGILKNDEHDYFSEDEDGKWTYNNSFIHLPKLEVKRFPYYDSMLIYELKNNYIINPDGYIIHKDEIITTFNYIYHIVYSQHFKIIFIINETKESFVDLYTKFIEKYKRGEFLSMWKIRHPLSTFTLYNFLPENTEEKIDANNDYILDWIKL